MSENWIVFERVRPDTRCASKYGDADGFGGGGRDGCDGGGRDGCDGDGFDGGGSDGCDGCGNDGRDITGCDGGGSDGGVYVMVVHLVMVPRRRCRRGGVP